MLPQLLITWKLGDIPTPTQSLDQIDAGEKAILPHRQRCLFVGQQRRLRGHDCGEVGRTGAIFVEGDLDGLAR